MSFKNSDKYYDGLHVFVANETNIDFSAIPSQTAGRVAITNYLESNFTFTRLFAWTGQQLSIDPTQNEQVYTASECDLGEVDRSTEKLVGFTGNIMSVRDESVHQKLAQLIGANYEVVAGDPVAVVGEALGTNASAGDVIFLQNKNGANTVVTAVVVDLAGVPLLAGTDYELKVDDGTLGRLGQSYIVFLLDKTGVLDVDYTYTPASSYGFALDGRRSSVNYTILKCVSCATTPDGGGTAVSDVFYVVKAYLSSPFDIAFPASTEEFTPAPMNFMEAIGGRYVSNMSVLN